MMLDYPYAHYIPIGHWHIQLCHQSRTASFGTLSNLWYVRVQVQRSSAGSARPGLGPGFIRVLCNMTTSRTVSEHVPSTGRFS
jgi:hypothetical protein